MNKLRTFFLVVLVEGLCCLAFLLAIPADPKNVWLFGLSPVRLGLSLVFFLAILFSLFIIWSLYKQSYWAKVIYSITGRIYFHDSRLLFVSCLSITIIFICGGFFLYWCFLSQQYHAIMLRLSPFVLFILLSNFTFLFTVRNRLQQAWLCSEFFQSIRNNISKYKLLEILMVLLLLLISSIYYELATEHAKRRNRKANTSDQSAYLNFSEKVWDSNFRYLGGRNRMPAYAFLQAAFYRPSLNDHEFFIQAKQVNIILSLALLTLTFFILRRYLSILPAINLVLIFAFGLYVFKAGYVQVELLFYFMIFVLIILMVKMLTSPSIKLGIVTGIWLGITQLSKAAMLPLLALFTVIFLIKETIGLIPRLRSYEYKGDHKSLFYRLSSLLVVILCFLIVIYPYISESKRIYGHYFYNVNSTFYIWYDSWDESKQLRGDRAGWPDVPENQIPTFSKYMREHSPEQIYQRVVRGLENQFNNILNPYSFFNYSLIYFSVLVVFGLINYKTSARLIQKSFWPMIFFLGFLIGYLISYAWFSPIANWLTYRFTYTLYLPFLFWTSVAIHKIVGESSEVVLSGRITKPGLYLKLIDITILGLIILDIVHYIPGRVMSDHFGA